MVRAAARPRPVQEIRGDKQMTALEKIGSGTRRFFADYFKRHAHPLNAALHLAGVPMVAAGLYFLASGRLVAFALLFVCGYFLQYLGHKAQGNEVGELTLIKAAWRKLMLSGRG